MKRRINLFLKYINILNCLITEVCDKSVKNLQEKYDQEVGYLVSTNNGHILQILLINQLKLIENEALEYYKFDIVKQFIYFLCGFTDEMIIEYHEQTIPNWTDYLLEKNLFNTVVSGDRIKDEIYAYIDYHDYKNDEMGLIYHYALSLGYKGVLKVNLQKFYELKKSLFYCICDIYKIDSIENINRISNTAYMRNNSNVSIKKDFDYSSAYINLIIIFGFLNLIVLVYMWNFYIKIKFI